MKSLKKSIENSAPDTQVRSLKQIIAILRWNLVYDFIFFVFQLLSGNAQLKVLQNIRVCHQYNISNRLSLVGTSLCEA